MHLKIEWTLILMSAFWKGKACVQENDKWVPELVLVVAAHVCKQLRILQDPNAVQCLVGIVCLRRGMSYAPKPEFLSLNCCRYLEAQCLEWDRNLVLVVLAFMGITDTGAPYKLPSWEATFHKVWYCWQFNIFPTLI